MADFRVDFSGKAHQFSESEIRAAVEAMEHADPLTQGRYQQEFERKFGEYNGTANCHAVSTCTAALELAAILCRLKKGDEVIIPAHTFCATAIPFARTGAKIVWADIDPRTLVISPETIRPLLTRKTRAIVAVHLYGLMAPMPGIRDLASERGILLTEDCAQAIGSSIGGVKSGNFGDFACFSFHTHKNMTTLGEGGMLVVRDGDTARHVPGLRHNGLRPYEGDRSRYWVPAMSNVDLDLEGVLPYNFCIGEVQCAVGTRLLERIDGMNREKNERARRFRDAVRDYPELVFQEVPEGYFHNYHLLVARYDGGEYGRTSHDFISRMAFTHGVKCVVQYNPLYRYPLFRKIGLGKGNCPESEFFFDNMVSFPFHHWMGGDDLRYVLESALETLEYLRKSRGS